MISRFFTNSAVLWADLEFPCRTCGKLCPLPGWVVYFLSLGCFLSFCSFFSDWPFGESFDGEKCYCWCFLAWCNLEDFIKCILCNFSPLSPRLSAFVLRCFLEADPYIDIDQNVLHRTYTWLKGHQKSNGEFWEPGRVIHSELQGGNKSPVTLTAYIVTSLLGYKKYQVFNI